MKHKKILILLFLGLFLNITNIKNVKAENLTGKNISNGKVSISLNSNKGYIGALDATITLTGNISFSKIEWDSSLNDLAMKEYEYNKNTKSIRIFLVTKNTKQNLLDKDGNLKIGTIVVTSQKKETYSIKLSKLSITNLDLEKTEISAEELTSPKTESFTVSAESTTITTSPSGNNNQSSTKTPSTNEDNKVSDDKNKDDEEVNNNDNNQNEEVNNNDDKLNEDKNVDNKKESKKEIKNWLKKYLPYIIVVTVLLVITIITGIIYYISKRKKIYTNLDMIENQIIEKESDEYKIHQENSENQVHIDSKEEPIKIDSKEE